MKPCQQYVCAISSVWWRLTHKGHGPDCRILSRDPLLALNQLQHFGDELSPPILSNQISQSLVSVRVSCLPVELIQMVNGLKLSLQIFQSTHAPVVSISVPNWR